MTADTSELAALADGLAASGADVDKEVRKVVSKGALNIKREWASNARASSGRMAPAYPSSISYTTTERGGVTEAEIGPDKGRRQGALGNVLEFGSVNNPPHNDGGRALDAEAPRFLAAMEAVAAQLTIAARGGGT